MKKKNLQLLKNVPEIISESKIVYDNKYSFCDYKNVRKYSDFVLVSKYY